MLLFLAGCARSPPTTRFYVLTAVPVPSPAPPMRDVSLAVGPVSLPAYLDRPQIVTRTRGDELDLAEFDQWAEPLRVAVPRVLAENLATQIPTERVVVYPGRGSRTAEYQVAVEMTRFEGTTGSDVVLRARWRLIDAQGRELALRSADLRETPPAGGYAALVAAQSRLLGRLGVEIAAAIAPAAR